MTSTGRPSTPPGSRGSTSPRRSPGERADVAWVLGRLRSEHPRARTELDHRSALELLVATVLSAQTTDVRVNQVTPELWRRWPDPAALAGADPAELAAVLRPLGMGPTRAHRLVALARMLLERFGGAVPDEQAALEELPGVGRKTALVVRGVWFGRSALAVDTHVSRVSRRLGWSTRSSAQALEREVIACAEADSAAEDLTGLSLRLILHGRRTCTGRTPRCGECVLAAQCPRVGLA